MAADFVKYRDFFESETAAEFVITLREHGVDYEVEEFNDSLGAPYGERPFSFVTTVKIRKEDFPRVDKLLADEAKEYAEHVGKDHYLYTFKNEELFEVIGKPDEWSAIDYQLAKTLLRQRGVMVDDVTFGKLKVKRTEDPSKQEPGRSNWGQIRTIARWIAIGGLIVFPILLFLKLI